MRGREGAWGGGAGRGGGPGGMRRNADLVLRGARCALVPYRAEHVAAYHAWMESAELRAATASERLTRAEEEAMQREWAADEGKATFIILDPARPDTPGTGRHGGAMAGDVNFFLNDRDDPRAAEVEVMVAEPASRRKGIAREALEMFLAWGRVELGLTRFVAKIGLDNAPSRALFAALGFGVKEVCEAFEEVHMELLCGEPPPAPLPYVTESYDG